MRHCVCSSRALEVFIQDVAGLSLRQQRAQRYFHEVRTHGSQRSFGTNVRSRHLDSTPAMGLSDHELLPFDFEVSKMEMDLPTKSKKDSENLEEDGPGWHAELEILRPEGQVQTLNASEGEHGTSDVENGPQSSVEETFMVTNTDHATHLFPTSSSAKRSDEEAIELVSSSTPMVQTTQPILQSDKKQSRLDRKARRLATGRYKPQAQTAEQETRTGSILDKINSMDGPTPHTPKTVAIREKRAAKARQAAAATEQAQTPTNKTSRMTSSNPKPTKKREPWQVQKAGLDSKFGDIKWSPRKRLSPDTLDGIRALHANDPATYSTAMLADHFKVSPDAIRRILKSKWQPNDEEKDSRILRWERRGVKKWGEMAEVGIKPPRRWRELGVGSVKGEPENKPVWKKHGGNDKGKRLLLLEAEEDELGGRIL